MPNVEWEGGTAGNGRIFSSLYFLCICSFMWSRFEPLHTYKDMKARCVCNPLQRHLDCLILNHKQICVNPRVPALMLVSRKDSSWEQMSLTSDLKLNWVIQGWTKLQKEPMRSSGLVQKQAYQLFLPFCFWPECVIKPKQVKAAKAGRAEECLGSSQASLHHRERWRAKQLSVPIHGDLPATSVLNKTLLGLG